MTQKARNTPLKAAVIGYGAAFNMGLHHLGEMRKAGMIPSAVCDIDAMRCVAAEKDFPGIATYTSAQTMLKKADIDIVTVITPHDSHAKLAVQCLNAGKHVVVEKPMAITTAECDRMIAAAKRNCCLLSAYHNRHWDGCILQAMKAIRSGALGEVYRVLAHMGGFEKPHDWWRSRKSVSGGILYDWGVHVLEYTLQIMDADIVEVMGFAHTGTWAPKIKWKKDACEDEAAAVIRFGNGGWAMLTMTSLDANPSHPWLEITGTKGSYRFEHDTYKLTTVRSKETVTRAGQNQPDQWPRYYENIAKHLAKKEDLVITAEWARRPIHIIDLACRSAAKGTSLKAKYK